MVTLEQLLREHPEFALPTQYRIGGAHGRTTVCFQNFYQQVFPDHDTPVDLYVLMFDHHGKQLDGVCLRVASGEAMQYRTDSADSGLVAAMAVPAFDLIGYNAGRLKLKHEIGTGFYVIWEDAAGHIDTMHEWMQVRTTSGSASRYYMVFDAAAGAPARAGLVLVNPHFGPGLETRATLTLYTCERTRLGTAALPPVAPMGARLVPLAEVFPEAPAWLARHGALGACVEGANLVEPLTADFHASGDLHLHHIN